jgi:hypothetical protein
MLGSVGQPHAEKYGVQLQSECRDPIQIMRASSILILVGLAPLVGGIVWAEYYTAEVDPARVNHYFQQCGQNRVPCPMPSPTAQPLFLAGVIAAVIGFGVLLGGLSLRLRAGRF